MDKPFSGHNFVVSPSIFPFSFPPFHQVETNGFTDINFFGSTYTDQLCETGLTTQIITSNDTSSKKSTGRKRSVGKDRHSKICTALGMRNRRMRLSLDVAPDFFDIQDMLGFDKASKTLRWLITMARPAIRELIASSRGGGGGGGGGSSKSCIESSTSDIISTNSDCKGKSKSECQTESKTTPKAKRVSKRAALIPARIAREMRLKARERARERTEKKRLLQSSLDHLLYDTTVPLPLPLPLDQLIAKVEEDCSHSRRSHEVAATIFDYNQSAMCPNDSVNLFHEHWEMEDVQLQTSRLWEG